MSETQIAEWTELLNKAEAEGILTREQPPLTLIEITGNHGHQTKENFYSNVLSFFFKTYEAHGLDDLFISSLLEVYFEKSKRKNPVINNIISNSVEREFQAITKERPTTQESLDLLIETDDFIIGIENKIYTGLQNDFVQYAEAVKQVADNYYSPQPKDICVLLSLFEKEEPAGFRLITYDNFFERVKKNLGKYATGACPEYLQFLLHFIKTIRNMTMNNELNEAMKKFLEQKDTDNVEKVQKLTNALDSYKEYLRSKLVSDENLEHFNKKYDIISACGHRGTKHRKEQIYIGCMGDIDSSSNKKSYQDLTNFGIDLFYCLPANVIIDVFLHGEGGSPSSPERTKKILCDASLAEEFKFKASGYEKNKFRIKKSIPMDEITNEDNVLDRLIKAILKEHEVKVKQAGG